MMATRVVMAMVREMSEGDGEDEVGQGAEGEDDGASEDE